MDKREIGFLREKALAQLATQFGQHMDQPLPQAIMALAGSLGSESSSEIGRRATEAMAKSSAAGWNSGCGGTAVTTDQGTPLKVLSKAVYRQELLKADLDVGNLTNFSQITGGQALGFVSLDTQLARGTVRPKSFTLHQALKKSAAYQIVDYWSYAQSTGGPLPGQAFANYSSVTAGALNTSAGLYELKNITLKMALDGRAITTALAAQNSFVNIGEQETANASLSVLESVNWTNYWGNGAIYSNQPTGIYAQLPSQNVFNFYDYYNTVASPKGVSQPQAVFDFIYEGVAQINSYRAYGRPTHAFMDPTAYGSLQGLSTTLLNNIVNDFSERMNTRALTINGDLRGMRTAFGEIGFEIDIFINARQYPAQAFYNQQTATSYATTSNPWAPVSVTVATGTVTPSGQVNQFDSNYGGGDYAYAVAGMDASMTESELTWVNVTGVPSGGVATLTINPSTAGTVQAFRIYRSGKGYSYSSGDATAPNQVRYIADVLANGSSAVTFTDSNQSIPGSSTIFLLDLDDADNALDYRYLLPLSRVNLFQNNLLMPWAVVIIGAPRVRIPKFHGAINNYVPENPNWNPLSANNPNAPMG